MHLSFIKINIGGKYQSRTDIISPTTRCPTIERTNPYFFQLFLITYILYQKFFKVANFLFGRAGGDRTHKISILSAARLPVASLPHMVSAIGFEPMHKSVMSRLPYHLAKRTGFREVSLSDRKGFYQWTSHRALSSWCLERDSNPHLMDFKSSASAVGLPRHLTGARSIAPERWFRRPPNYERRWFRLCCFFFLFA